MKIGIDTSDVLDEVDGFIDLVIRIISLVSLYPEDIQRFRFCAANHVGTVFRSGLAGQPNMLAEVTSTSHNCGVYSDLQAEIDTLKQPVDFPPYFFVLVRSHKVSTRASTHT